ncbi:MAG: hypothetical protein DMG15_05660 [Acidobacteria bacterium]|nr:MAG: hypothetical protein DMG15_05660 [Acidobacteriota bacterium]
MKRVLALSFGLFLWMASPSGLMAQAPLNNIILGHSGGAGSLNILRRLIERDKIWAKYGLNVKSVYLAISSARSLKCLGWSISLSPGSLI